MHGNRLMSSSLANLAKVELVLVLLLSGCAARTTAPKGPAVGVEIVAYQSGKETVRGVLCRPAGVHQAAAVVLVHGDRGLTNWVKDQASRLAGKGYVVLAVDLYRGEIVSDAPPGQPARVLLDAHILGRGLPDDQVLADLKAAVDYLAGRPGVRSEAIGIIGWDIGGGYALDAALHDPRLRAVVVCYGRLTTDPGLLAPLKAPVLGIFAGKDEGISPETIAQFCAAMRKANKRVAGIHTYPACGHDFMEEARHATADAWAHIDAFLGAELH